MAVKIAVYGTADLKQIERARRQLNELERDVKKNAGGVQGAFSKMSSGIKGMVPGMVAVGAAVGAVGFQLLKMGEEGLAAQARVDNIVRSMGLFGDQADAVSKRLGELADVQARATGVDDDTILATQAKLLTFRELAKTADQVGGAFDRTTTAALDLAAAGFGEATQNATQLGKALNDPVKGLTALARAGVTFTQAEKDKIKALVESGKMLEAQDTLLRAIETQVGGTAEATATASSRITVAWGQIAEEMGAELVPVLEDVADNTDEIIEAFRDLVAFGSGVKTFAENVREVQLYMNFGPAVRWVRELRDSLDDTTYSSIESKNAIYAAANATGRHGTVAQSTARSVDDLSEDLEETDLAAGDAAGAMDDLTRAMDGTMVASDDLSGKLRTLTELGLDQQEAAIRVREAERSVAKALEESGRDSDEYRSAVINLERAKLRASDATADLRAKETELGGTQSDLAKERDYENHLKRVRDAAMQAAEAIRTAKSRSQAKWGSRQSGGGAMQFGAGGVVSSPTFAMVGERNHPEYVITTEPAYRSRSLALLDSLSRDLGVRSSNTSNLTIAVDARGSTDPAAVEAAGYRGASRALAEAVSAGRLKSSMMGA